MVGGWVMGNKELINVGVSWYVSIFFMLAGMKVGCMPDIVSEGPGASMVIPIPGWRASIKLIVSYGTCTPDHHGYTLVNFSTVQYMYAAYT